MKGADRIIAMRCNGVKPVNLAFTDARPADGATVQYEPKDNPATTDIRFVIGLLVTVDGTDEKTVKAWAKACADAGAERVIWTLFDDRGQGESRKVKAMAMGDTEHIFDWAEA
jgi:hypothetical protein